MMTVMEVPKEAVCVRCVVCEDIISYVNGKQFYNNWGIELVEAPNVYFNEDVYCSRNGQGKYICTSCVEKFEPHYYAKVYDTYAESKFFYNADIIQKVEKHLDNDFGLAILEEIISGRDYKIIKNDWVKPDDKKMEAEWDMLISELSRAMCRFAIITKRVFDDAGIRYHTMLWLSPEDEDIWNEESEIHFDHILDFSIDDIDIEDI